MQLLLPGDPIDLRLLELGLSADVADALVVKHNGFVGFRKGAFGAAFQTSTTCHSTTTLFRSLRGVTPPLPELPAALPGQHCWQAEG